MDEGRTAETEAPRRRIIKRPRLTKLLDEADARILLLVAPAGYGKTTLARQWVDEGNRGALWVTATPALNDVATFAIRLRDALQPAFSDVGVHIEEMLRAGRRPSLEAEMLGGYLAETIEPWEPERWLLIDDYHCLESEQVERLVDAFLTGSKAQVLIATRRRPKWATARRVIYGEIHELGRNALAMTHDEAAEVLPTRAPGRTSGLIALADGWPAILGLAAESAISEMPGDSIPSSLYDFFAEELYRAAPPEARRALARLAFAPSITAGVAAAVLGDQAAEVLNVGTRLGFLEFNEGSASYAMHSLLRDFLRRRHIRSDGETERTLDELTLYYFDRKLLDDLFVLVSDFPESTASARATEMVLTNLLSENRAEAVEPWLTHARNIRLDTASVDLAAAELALRDAHYNQAELLATQSAERFPSDSPLKARAWFRAGLSAYLENRSAEALAHHARALEGALRKGERLQAIWGLLTATLEREGDASMWMTELELLARTDTVSRVRLANARLTSSYRFGGVPEAIADADAVLPLLDRIDDAMVTSGFLNGYAYCLVLATEYERALTIVERELEVINECRLTFAIPHALVCRAGANIGRRLFADARRDLDVADRAAQASADEYSDVSIALNRLRLALCEGKPTEAASLAVETRIPDLPGSLQGEVLSARGLALAASGDPDTASSLLSTAETLTRSLETQTYASWARVVVAATTNPETAQELAVDAFQKSNASGCLHPLVCAYRSCPAVLQLLANDSDSVVYLRDLLLRARDETLGRAVGLDFTTTRARQLSPRETEVLQLLGEGLSNRDIAKRLFISEVTAKVHVRHILDKLGVHSRTEAALLSAPYLADGDEPL